MLKQTDVKNLVEVILRKSHKPNMPFVIKGNDKDEQIAHLTAAIWIANRMESSHEAFDQAIVHYLESGIH